MKISLVLFWCLSFAGRCGHASEAVDLAGWRQRASETSAGMSLAEAERRFPLYTPPAAEHEDPTACVTLALSLGAHQLCARRVASDVVVWFDYYTSPADHPLTGPVTVERRYPRTVLLGLTTAPASEWALTLSRTLNNGADASPRLLR